MEKAEINVLRFSDENVIATSTVSNPIYQVFLDAKYNDSGWDTLGMCRWVLGSNDNPNTFMINGRSTYLSASNYTNENGATTENIRFADHLPDISTVGLNSGVYYDNDEQYYPYFVALDYWFHYDADTGELVMCTDSTHHSN